MKLTSKVKKILEFRKKHTLQETGDKFNLTQERIRQLEFLKHRKRCLVHNRYFYNKCSHCLDLKNYKLYMEHYDLPMLLKEVIKESKNRKRDFLSTQRRIYLVKRLRDKYEKSFNEIARLLDRDYTTIKYLYLKK